MTEVTKRSTGGGLALPRLMPLCWLGLVGSTTLFSSSASGESPGILEGKRETGFTLESIRRVGYLGWLERVTPPWLKWTERSVSTTHGRFGQTMFVQELAWSTLYPEAQMPVHVRVIVGVHW